MAKRHSPPPSVSPPASKRPRTADKEDHRGSSDSRAAAAAPALSLAGFIFMCSGETKPDCYRHRVLGLPRGRLDAVSRIKRGAALFLYDFDIKHLYGPYRADSDGGLDLVPAAFHGRFPAQVKFKIEGDFMPLHESSLRSVIMENYVKGKFSPELNSTQVEKLRMLFQPIALHPESSPPHYVDDNPPAAAVYLPPSASYPAQPVAYARHPTANVPPPSAHLVPPESYAPPCSYLARPTAQPTTHAYSGTTAGYSNQAGYEAPEFYAPPCSYMAPPTAQPTSHAYSGTTAGYGYQSGYEAYGPMPSTYQYAQVSPSCSMYTQYSMSKHAAPVYSTGPHYAAYQNDPYQLCNVTSHYQQSTHERAACDAGHGTVTTNLQLVRRYGFTPSDVTEGTTRISDVDGSQQAVTYTTHAAGRSAHGTSSVDYAYAAPSTSYTDAARASSQIISPVIPAPPPSVYVAAAAPAYQ